MKYAGAGSTPTAPPPSGPPHSISIPTTASSKSLFSGNTQLGSGNGGALTLEYSGATVRNVTIVGTEAHYYGGGIFGSTAAGVITPPRFENVLIAGNLARYAGGGLCLNDFWGDAGTVVNCTIADNRTYEPNATSYGGGGLYLRGCTSTITNSIIHGNTTAGAGPQIRLSDVRTKLDLGFTDLAGGTGNIHNPDAAALSTGSGMLDTVRFQDPQTGAWSNRHLRHGHRHDPLQQHRRRLGAGRPRRQVPKPQHRQQQPHLHRRPIPHHHHHPRRCIPKSPMTPRPTRSAITASRPPAPASIPAPPPASPRTSSASLAHRAPATSLGAYERVPDGIPPASVSGLRAVGGLDLVALSWTNPASTADFAGVLIVRRAGAAPVGEPVSTNLYTAGNSIGNGTVAYVGSGNNAAPGAPSG